MTSQPFNVFDLVFPNRLALADLAVITIEIFGQVRYQATLVFSEHIRYRQGNTIEITSVISILDLRPCHSV
jgi:hypothetical protein